MGENAGELAELSARIDELIAPYVHRTEAEAPAGARIVRILRHYLPGGRGPGGRVVRRSCSACP